MAEGKFVSVGAILKRYSQTITDALKKNLSDVDERGFNHIASYKLWQSIQAPVSIYGSVYTMEIKMEDYWKYVEFGREPGKFPPVEPIVKWTVQKGFSMEEVARSFRQAATDRRRAKGIKARQYNNLKRKPKAINREAVRKQLAFVIARSIAKKGIPPTYFASSVLGDSLIHEGIAEGKLWDNLRADISEAVGQDIQLQVSIQPY